MSNIFEKLATNLIKEDDGNENFSSKTITSKIQNINTGFAALDNHIETGIKFNDKEIKVFRQGKTINVQEWINKGNNDITIYDVLATYHGDLQMTQEALNHTATRLSDAFAHINSLKDVYDIQKKAGEEWDNLPLEIRREFGHDIKRFVNEGESWVNKKIEELTKAAEAKKAEEGVENNG